MHYHTILFTIVFYLFSGALWAQEKDMLRKVYSKDCLLGLEDAHSREILPTKFSTIEILGIGNDWLITAKRKTGFNYYLYQKEKLTRLPYSKVEKLNERLLKIGEHGEYGLINTTGKGILLMDYQQLVPAGVASIITRQKNLYGVIDLMGQPILTNEYDALKYWTMGGFWGLKDGDYQLFDQAGKKVGKTVCDIVRVPVADLPVCGVRKDKKWGVVNTKNELILDFQYKNILFLEVGLIAVLEADKKWSLLDLEGNKIKAKKYDLVLPCMHSQYAKVVLGNKVGLVDGSGKLILPIKYQKIDYIGDRWLAVTEEKGIKLFDIQTQQFLEKEFQAILNDIDNKDWTGFFVEEEGKWRWFDFKQGEQYSLTFPNVSRTSSGLLLVENENHQLGVLNGQATLVLPIEYQAITPKDDFFKVKKGNDWYFVNQQNAKVSCISF